ncbi:hypothetical protein CK203_047122 [Vitis vinifera]|uniref:Uncharacterized protein n=1 Tax=Vitis vinifera TaxID=29760 RepID=A0A438HDV2_VITVI|nr:hypothetical protein CK203_047122 [Vitis vinifera]
MQERERTGAVGGFERRNEKNLEGKIKRRTGAAGGFEGEKGGLERGRSQSWVPMAGVGLPRCRKCCAAARNRTPAPGPARDAKGSRRRPVAATRRHSQGPAGGPRHQESSAARDPAPPAPAPAPAPAPTDLAGGLQQRQSQGPAGGPPSPSPS